MLKLNQFIPRSFTKSLSLLQEVMKFHCITCCLLVITMEAFAQSGKTVGTKAIEQNVFYSLGDFKKIQKTDTHVHIGTYLPDFARQCIEDNFRVITINLDDPTETLRLEELQRFALSQLKNYPAQVAYATTFSIGAFNESGWKEATIAYLKNSFSKGAIAVKIYKVIGMYLLDKNGAMVMIHDSRFDPVIDFIEKKNIPVLGHLGEPKNCWMPLDKMGINGDRSYFKANPAYHMFLHPELPTYEMQIAARNKMLENHPHLKFIGAHLGSLEWSVDELAKRLDKFPNMAVDMAARISHFQYQASKDW